MQKGTPPTEALETGNAQPYIIWFQGEDDDDNIGQQLFIVIEGEMMLETNCLMSAVFGCVAAHYIFNLAYHEKTGDFWKFIQEKILGIPSKSCKKNPSTTSHFSGITRFASQSQDDPDPEEG